MSQPLQAPLPAWLDPEATGKEQNLSVRRFPPLIDDATLRAEAETLLREVIASARFAMDWRNLHIAHRDLGLPLGQQATPLRKRHGWRLTAH